MQKPSEETPELHCYSNIWLQHGLSGPIHLKSIVKNSVVDRLCDILKPVNLSFATWGSRNKL